MTTNPPPQNSRRNWRDDATCSKPGYDAELWFPVSSFGPGLVQTATAKAVCASRCPVIEECLKWAMETRQETGVWGGLSEDERKAMRTAATGTQERRKHGVPLVRQVLAHVVELEALDAAGLTAAEIAERIGVEGATKDVVAEARRQVRQWKRQNPHLAGTGAAA
jgi:WhiB family redox-sensing transcriptional regulator